MRARLTGLMQRSTLARRFMLASLFVLVFSMLGVGWWVGRQIEQGVINRTAATTALYVDSFVTPRVQDLATGNTLSPEQVAIPMQLLQESPLGQQVVSFKIWGPGGRVIHASDSRYIGQVFPLTAHLRDALRGEVQSELTNLDEAEDVHERERWTQLLETYIPVYQVDSDRVIGVAEFYQTVGDLEREIAAAQRRSWLAVGLGTLATYLLLGGIVQHGSNTIVRQQRELRDQIARLSTVLAENEVLHKRVRSAATRTTTLNERYLRRLSAELHDGPAQELSHALLRLDSVIAHCGECPLGAQDAAGHGGNAAHLDRIQTSLRQALREVRAISAGLRLPELGRLTLPEALERVVHMHERRTETRVALVCDDVPAQVPLPAKITAYRLIEEALNNAYRHGGGRGQEVHAAVGGNQLHIDVSDHGPGFDGEPVVDSDQHLGLVGMRERVESMGGVFRIRSAPDQGTTVSASIPLQPLEDSDERTDPDGDRGRSPAPARRRRAHAAR